MPLKHDTETQMVFFLGLLIALAGAIVAFLPPVSVSVWPWAIAFALSLIYPLMLYPMMKERRADHEFRALHFAPALILLLWLALDLLVTFRPSWQVLQSLYTWSWSAVIVAAALALLAAFCFRVIRQRVRRVGWLLAVFLPFVLLAQVSEVQEWDRQLAMVLWDGQEQTGTGQIAVGGTSSNLAPSSDGAEEQWRAELRRMERRRQQLANETSSSVMSESPTVRGAKTGTIIAAGGLPEKPTTVGPGEEEVAPPALPSSGFGVEGLALAGMAGYCAALHRRTIRRRRRA